MNKGSTCPNTDNKSTLPKSLDWLNDYSPAREAGEWHDEVRCNGMHPFPAWLVYGVMLILTHIVNTIAIPLLFLGLGAYELLPKSTKEKLLKKYT